MKKGAIILWTVILLPLLCITAQQWEWSLTADHPTEVTGQWEQPQQQQPLEDEREYTTNDMWCLLQTICTSGHHTKWQGCTAGTPSAHQTHPSLPSASGHTSSHLPFPTDGSSVIIRLHHLII